MKTRIHTDGFEGWAKRAKATAQKLDCGERVTATRTFTFESPLDMLKVLTAERMRLCIVARKKAYSVTALATALKRDPKSVRRDVSALEKYGVLRTREEVNPGHGKLVIVEPVAERFEFRATF